MKDLVHIDVILSLSILKNTQQTYERILEDSPLFDCYYEAYSAREDLLSIEYPWKFYIPKKGLF